MTNMSKEVLKQYEREMQDDIEDVFQYEKFCQRMFSLIEKHFNQSRLMTKSDFEKYSKDIKKEMNIND
jgi:hypothetical protein